MQRIVFIAEKNKNPEAFAGTAMIFPWFKGFPKHLWTGKYYENIRNNFVLQLSLQL